MKKKKIKKKDWFDKKFFIVHIDVYSVDIVFCVDQKEEEIKKYLKKVSGENYEKFDESLLDEWDEVQTNLGRMVPFSGGFVVLLKVTKEMGFRHFLSIAAHEVIHVTHYMLRNRRIPLSEDTEEVYTYLSENILLQTLNKLY